MDPFQVSPITVILNDVPVRIYMGFMQGVGLALAYFAIKKLLKK